MNIFIFSTVNNMGNNKISGVIAFEDGTVFRGKSFGAIATSVGECCFNTSLTGYQEIITDPSYFFFFSSRRRHTRLPLVSWARRCV